MIRTTRDLPIIKHNHKGEGHAVADYLPKHSIIHDLKEPRTGVYTALVPELGRRVTFGGKIDIDAFEEISDD